MYPAFDLERVMLRAIMDISARAVSLRIGLNGAIGVTSVRMRREDRSSISFLILSQTSAGKAFSTIRVESRGLNLAGLEGSPMS